MQAPAATFLPDLAHLSPLLHLPFHPICPQARQRLELRLQERDAQLGKLRGVVRELEGKLIDAYKRQADL